MIGCHRLRSMRLSGVLMLTVVAAGCGRGESPSGTETADATASQSDCANLMQPIIDAVWDGKPDAIEGRFDGSLVVVEQRYELAESEPPYVLGPAQSRSIANSAELVAVLRELATRAAERDGDLIPNPRDAAGSDWDTTLAGFVPVADTNRCAITLEVGDVEHVLVAALDKTDASIRGLYTN